MSHMAAYTNQAILSRYHAWDQANPSFYALFVKYSLELITAGRRSFGVRLVWERIRWESMIQTQGDQYKMNDHYHAIYARRFMDDHPQFGNVFKLRTIH